MDFIVSNLNDTGSGSLRWAIDQANATTGFDSIGFNSNLAGGTIQLSSALAPLTDRVAINGLISGKNAPQIAVNFNKFSGLEFSGTAASNSSLKGLALINAGGNGLTLNTGDISVQNTYIGVGLDGMTGMGNAGHGILITSQSSNNLIGTLDPLTGQPLEAQVSNVISANRGSGIVVQGSEGNRIANNRIGTSADGTRDLGNAANGILLTLKANNNTIGGNANKGNNPTQGQFARPGQGNLISGNGAAGVRIESASSSNTLSGNFIGTNSKGTSAIANDGDGVAIINSNNNALRGTTRNESPFIYYNVVSGNRGNGLRILNSNSTTIHANFFGLGANNSTIVANKGDGALIEGTSTDTQYGGVIPLGNVNAGNDRNGIAVTDQAKGFISFNTFAGLTAFGGIAPNKLSGIAVSSSGGNTQIRTNVMSGNQLHGLHITGKAKDVWVDPNIIGLNSYGTAATYTNKGRTVSWANGVDGIRVDGQASDIRISGNRKSVIPQNTISNNKGHGIRLLDKASKITIDNTYVGLSSTGKATFGNNLGGLYADAGVTQLQIGTVQNKQLNNQFVGNGGNGITLIRPSSAFAQNNTLLNNRGSGLAITGGDSNTVVGNQASNNDLYGFDITASTNNVVKANTGTGNRKGLYNQGVTTNHSH